MDIQNISAIFEGLGIRGDIGKIVRIDLHLVPRISYLRSYLREEAHLGDWFGF